MATKEKLLQLLSARPGVYLSGEELAKTLGVSRAAVCKAAKALRDQGHSIQGITNKGYALTEAADLLDLQKIEVPDFWQLKAFPSLPSTNSLLRELASQGAPEGTVILSGSQTEGRGRMGRSFYSPEGTGIYLSFLLRPKDFSPTENLQITTMAAAALCLAIEEVTGKQPKIKWVNDVFLNGKKICGILTEASLSMETGLMDWAVVGLGINLYTPPQGFPEALSSIAGALYENQTPGLKNKLVSAFLRAFLKLYQGKRFREAADIYRSRSLLTGKTVLVGDRKALVLDVNHRCQLVVRFENGKEQALSYGEVTIVNPNSL